MKQSNTLRAVISNKIISTVVVVTTFFMIHPVCAQAQKLDRVKGVLGKFKDELNLIIPVAASVILLCLALGYAGRYIEKDTFVRWAIGVVIAGSAVEIANVLFKP